MYGVKLYNKRPTGVELEYIETVYAACDFSGFVGALYCSKLTCKNCPLMWKGQYHTKKMVNSQRCRYMPGATVLFTHIIGSRGWQKPQKTYTSSSLRR